MMPESPSDDVRLDKWLWSARIFKTRSLATEACRAGHVRIEGERVKPSHHVRIGEVITATTADVERQVRVIGLLSNRVGGAAAQSYAEDVVPPKKLGDSRPGGGRPVFLFPKGHGRPTKRDRRRLEHLWSGGAPPTTDGSDGSDSSGGGSGGGG